MGASFFVVLAAAVACRPALAQQYGALRIDTLFGAGAATTVTSAGVPASSAYLDAVGGIVVDSNRSRIYVSDRGRHVVRRVDVAAADNVTLYPFAGSFNSAGFAGDSGAATAAQLNTPSDLALGANGLVVFVLDFSNARVRAVSVANGTIVTYAGGGASFLLPGRRRCHLSRPDIAQNDGELGRRDAVRVRVLVGGGGAAVPLAPCVPGKPDDRHHHGHGNVRRDGNGYVLWGVVEC